MRLNAIDALTHGRLRLRPFTDEGRGRDASPCRPCQSRRRDDSQTATLRSGKAGRRGRSGNAPAMCVLVQTCRLADLPELAPWGGCLHLSVMPEEIATIGVETPWPSRFFGDRASLAVAPHERMR